MSLVERAAAAFSAAVAPENVEAAGGLVAGASRTTYATTQRPLLVVRPATTAEVQACVRIAGELGLAVYPSSGGRNWGYGARVPTTDGAVLLDLARMKRIVEYDPELAFVTVEAGVTQEQLRAFLAERGEALWIDPTTAPSDASVVGNLVERGHGYTPYADRAARAASLEVVLANGEVVETGYASFGTGLVSRLEAVGCGPSLDGLFLQSNLGIVTRATLHLMPAPERVAMVVAGIDEVEAVGPFVDAVRSLRLDGVFNGAAQLANVYRRLAYVPGIEATLTTRPVAVEEALAICAPHGIHRWNGLLSVYGRAKVVDAQVEVLTSTLRPLATTLKAFDVAQRDDIPPAWRGIAGLVAGRLPPGGVGVNRMYFRKPAGAERTSDPERDRCGFVWCPSAVPARGADALRVITLVERTLLAHGFEPDLALSYFRDRSIHAMASIVFDRDVPGEDERALACHDALAKELVALGCPPVRLGLHSMHLVPGGPSAELVETLRRALDPGRVIAPGRYERAR